MKITRAFSQKVNLGNYQTADFFCSVEEECEFDCAEKISEQLNEMCRYEVNKSIVKFNEERTVSVEVLKSEPAKELNFKDVKLNGD